MFKDLFSLKCLGVYFSSCPTLALVNYTWENNDYWPKSMVCRVCVYHLCISQHVETCHGGGITWLWEAGRCSQTLSQIWMWFWVHNFSQYFIVGTLSTVCTVLDWKNELSKAVDILLAGKCVQKFDDTQKLGKPHSLIVPSKSEEEVVATLCRFSQSTDSSVSR